MKIIVLQLARFGDIIQTLPAIQALKKANSKAEITLVVRSTFADAARLSPHVDRLIEMPTAEILGPYFEAGQDKVESLARLIRWFANELAGTEYDQVINLTFSPASAYLSSLIQAKERRGVMISTLSTGNAFMIADSWSQYFFSQVLERNLNIIHLNDLMARIAGHTSGGWPLELREPKGIKVAHKDGRTRIGVQLTASNPEKTLSIGLWARVCNELLSRNERSELVFFGSGKDLGAIQAVLEAMQAENQLLSQGRATILAGKYRFNENLPWVKSCDWIVAPDTAIVHLASACGTKVIEIPVGQVRPEETGPYGEGHHVVYPARATGDELAIQVARIVAGEKPEAVVADAVTRLVTCSDGSLRCELVPNNFVQEEASGFFMAAYYLLAEFRCGGRQEDITIPPLGDPAQPAALDRIAVAYDALCTIRQAADFGRHYCLKMLENLDDKAQLQDLMRKLGDIEEMLAALKKSVSLVKPLIDTWRVAKDVSYTPGTELAGLEAILVLTEGCYRELGQDVEVVQQLLQTAVDAAQKKHIQKQSSEVVTKERV